MKRIFSLMLAVMIAASVLASCGGTNAAPSSTSSGYADGAWLEERLGSLPANVTVGTADALGIDMADFDEDGYFIRTSDGETVVCGKNAIALDVAVRAFAKAYEAGQGVPDVTYHEGERIKRLTIVGTDISEFTVVRRSGDSIHGRDASAEMVRLIEKSCGVTLPTVIDGTAEHMISITLSDDPELKQTGYRYRVENGNVYIEGAYIIGIYNGVYRFLERELGWIDLTYGYSRLPEADAVDVPEGASYTEHPAFDYIYDRAIYYDMFPNERCSFAQSFHGIVEKATHAVGWWYLSEDLTYTQPCYTDQYVIDETTENVLVYVGEHLGGRPTVIQMGQVDIPYFCTCKNCRAVMKQENGSQAGCVVRFANAVSDAIAEEYPDEYVIIPIFAYQNTKVPPKTAPRDNIYITFCTDGACAKHALNDPECSFGNDYADYIHGWGALSEHVYIWFYFLDNNFHQYEVFYTLYDDMRFLYKDCGVMGFQPQMDFTGLGFGKVQHNLIQHFNWDPEMTEEEYWDLVGELLYEEYGDGWEYIREFIRWDHEASMGASDCDCWSYGVMTNADQFNWKIRDRDFDMMRSLIEKAISLANSADQERRCELLLVPLYYLECYGTYFHALDVGDTEKVEKLNEYYNEIALLLTKYGFNPAAFVGQDRIKFALTETLAELAETKWEDSKSAVLLYWK